MLRLVGFLVMLVIGAGGLLLVDYNTLRQAAEEDAPPLSFGDYLGQIPDRVASATASISGDGLPGALDEMLPRAPEGWTLRPATRDDAAVFLPKKGVEGDPAARELIASIVSSRVARGAEVVVQVYEKDDRRVLIQAIRYPDSIFTNPAAAEQRFDLRMQSAERMGRPYMTVRGLDVTEDFLGDGMRARYFLASVGAQIQIRMLTTKRMKDEDLLPFFETLHVEAMNASVVDKVEGLGTVPVIVLASALGKAEREAYEADRAARRDEAVALAVALREADLEAARAATPAQEGAEGEAPAKPTAGFAADCAKGSDGTKRCNVGAGD